MSKKVVIIGGAGTIGTLYGDMLRDRYAVEIIDTSPKAKEIAEAHGYSFIDNKIKGYEEQVKDADLVVFSVPIEDTEAIIKEYANFVKPGAVAMDVTSVKEFAVETMLKYTNNDVNVIGTHPMFRPGKDNSFEGQNVVLTKERIVDKEIYEEVKSMFESKGAKTIETSAKRHDQIMAVIQCLMHDSGYSIIKSIEDSRFKLEELEPMSSPLYRTALAFTTRLLEGNPSLSASILIYNRYAYDVSRHLKDNANELSALIRRKDKETLENHIRARQKYARRFIEKTRQEIDEMLKIKKRGFEIYYFEEHDDDVRKALGNDVVIEQYKAKSYIWERVRKDLHEKAEKRKKPLKKNIDEYKIGKVKRGLIVNEGSINKLKKAGFILAEEMFWNSEEYDADGKHVFTIDNEEFVRSVLGNIDFVRYVLKDEKLAEQLLRENNFLLDTYYRFTEMASRGTSLLKSAFSARKTSQRIPENHRVHWTDYTKLKFDTQKREDEVHKDWYTIKMANSYDTDPILKFLKEMRLSKWEETFGRPIVIVRSPKRRKQEEKKRKITEQEKEPPLKK